MALAPDRRQFSINEISEIVDRIDEVAAELGMSRPELYAAAIRKLLKDPRGTVAEILQDRAAELAAQKEDS